MVNQHPSFPDEYYHDPLGLNRYVVQEKDLYTWSTPSKVAKSWKRSEIQLIILTIMLIGALLILVGEWALALLLVIAVGVSVLVATTAPTQLNCKVTTIGIKVEDKYYYWEQLTQYWFEEKNGVLRLFFRDIVPQVSTIKLIIPEEDQEKIQTTIGAYLLFKKPQQTKLQKFVQSIVTKLPFDTDLF